MKYALVNGVKTHAKSVQSGVIGKDIWYPEYEVKAHVGKYRQFWVYTNGKPKLPNGYEPESDWHAAWKTAIIDDACEVICGENREHRADIKTNKYVIEIQRSPMDGWDVVERNEFYYNLLGVRLVWVVNIEEIWRKTFKPEFDKTKEGEFPIIWTYKRSWIMEIAVPTTTFLYLDFNPLSDKMIYMWGHRGKLYGKWVNKLDFFNSYLTPVAKESYLNGENNFLDVFKDIENKPRQSPIDNRSTKKYNI